LVEVRIAAPGWRRALRTPAAWCRRAALAALAAAGVKAAVELSLVLADDAMLASLNRRYRARRGPTNVLSFPAEAPAGAPKLLGDVVLALETAQREARREHVPLAAYVARLVAHGVLHLLGYDHRTALEERRMDRRIARALADLGVSTGGEAVGPGSPIEGLRA
jgi:probable rRNA maturation factor